MMKYELGGKSMTRFVALRGKKVSMNIKSI